MKELLNTLHNRHKIVAEKYGPKVAHASHVGEGVYLGGTLFLEHHAMIYIYGGLFALWVVHTVVIGMEK